MCGFLGNCSFKKKVSYEKLKASSMSLCTRGPDASGEYSNTYLNFFHKRLSIIDLSDQANQPFICSQTKNVIIFNGEIYNYIDLKKDLIANHSVKFKTNSDTETILLYYQIYGIDKLLKKIDGMFAFAIWDNNEKQLYLARDKIGEKPLFFLYDLEFGITFGSTFKSVADSLNRSIQLSKKSLLQYLSLSYLLFQNTFDENIQLLQPGSYLIFKNNIIKKKIYWLLENIILLPKKHTSLNSSSDELQKLLNNSLDSRTISDVEVGAYFSGGLDSTLIVDILKKKNIYDKGFDHLFFDQENFSENQYAKDISNELGFKVNYYKIPPPDEIADNFKNIVSSMDQPLGDTAYISNYYLAKNSSTKFKVVLSGDGGDELFAGYETYLATYINEKLNKIIKPNCLLLRLLKKINLRSTYQQKVGFGYKLTKFIENYRLDSVKAHLSWRSVFSEYELKEFIYKNNLNYDQIIFDELNNRLLNLKDVDLISKCIFVDLITWFPNNILYKVDRASMTFSQECRIPMLDPEIIKFSFQLPNKYKKKLLIKNILKNRISKKNINRKKEGFNAPVGYWIANNSRFRSLTYDLLFSKNITKIFNKKIIEEMLNDHSNLKKDNTYKIYNLMVLSQWLLNNKQY